MFRTEKTLSLALGLAMLVGLTGCGGEEQANWTYWRGPTFNGVSDATGLVSSWSPEGENLAWMQPFTGRSTPVVVDGRVCANGRTGDDSTKQEIVACWDADSGDPLWEDKFNVYNTTVPFNRVGWASLAADPETSRIYAHGVAGQLNCYDSADGTLVWSRFLAEEVGRLSGYGGRTQTPLVDGDKLILTFVSANWGKHAAPRHRTFAFDKRTGDVLWVSTPGNFPFDMNTQSAPVIAEVNGQRLLFQGNADGHIYGLKVETGEKVWEFELSRRGINSTVLVDGERLFVSHSEENVDSPNMGRLVALDVSGSGDVTDSAEIWRVDEMAAGFPSPALKDGVLYVVDNSANLFAFDAASGEELWEHNIGTVGKGSPVLADGKIYVTETNGHFHILEADREGVEVLDSDELKVPDGRYAEIYGSAAIAHGRVFFTTEAGVYALAEGGAFQAGTQARDAGGTPAGSGEAAWLQVSPTELVVVPGESLQFSATAFDAQGRPLGAADAEFELAGLPGTIDAEGNFTADAAATLAAGTVKATSGSLEAAARVRVIAPLPWEDDLESYEVGKLPPTWVGAPGKFVVQEKDGGKVLTKLYRKRGLLRNAFYMGPSDMTNFTITAEVMGGKRGRRKSDAGLIAGGYTFDLMGNKQKVQIRTWPSENRITHDVEYAWETGKWYHLKLKVDTTGSTGKVYGKVWPKGGSEPDAWTIEVEDPLPIAGGSPGLLGYSPADTYYDNIKVTVN
ncbi:MAG: PQQ-binding-like beta-propeller repeat protein [bacterium]|nr:PQQ-binding-like beta-propeller repeat protein [bacterium]